MIEEQRKHLIAEGEAEPAPGPIGEYIEALAQHPRDAKLAMGVCTLRIEEAAPALRALLERAAAGETLSEREADQFFSGIHVLSAGRDTAGFGALLQFLARPDDEVDLLLGDGITQTLPRLIIGMFDGDQDGLLAGIANPASDGFIRGAMLAAAAFLAWEGRVDSGSLKSLLQDIAQSGDAEHISRVWFFWEDAVGLLGFADLLPLHDEMRRLDGLEPYLDDKGVAIRRMIAAAEKAPRDVKRFNDAGLGYIDDIATVLDWVGGPHDASSTAKPARSWQDYAPRNSTPVVNPLRDVGRNDPCPCGSGKKFKKCCLEA